MPLSVPIYHVRCQGPQQGKSTCSHLKGLSLIRCHAAPELPAGLVRASPACNTSHVQALPAADQPRARAPSPKGAVTPQGHREGWGRARSDAQSHSSKKNPPLDPTATRNLAMGSAMPRLPAAAQAPRWHGTPPSLREPFQRGQRSPPPPCPGAEVPGAGGSPPGSVLPPSRAWRCRGAAMPVCAGDLPARL